MKNSAVIFLLLAGAALVAAPGTKSSDASVRLRQRIDALLLHRNKPEPLPVMLPNPFAVLAGGAVRPDEGDDGEPVAVDNSGKTGELAPVDTNAEALAKGIAKLRFGGMVTVKGTLQIVINDIPRKEGDVIVLDRNNAMTYLHVVHIAKNELTLSLNDATQTVRF